MDWLSYIKELVHIFKEWNITQHLVALKDFYFNPKRFWKKRDRLSLKNRRIQYITYLLIFVCVILGSEGYTIENAFNLLLHLVPLTLVAIVLLVGFWLSKSNKINLTSITIYCCYYMFLLFPITVIFWRAYEMTGDYHILFLHNVIYALLDLYLWFAPALIFITNWNKRIFTIISIFVVLNIAEVVIFPMRSNDASSYHNYIVEERYELGKEIKNAYIIPYCVVTNKINTESFYLYSGPIDSIAHRIDTKEYFEELYKDVDVLKNIFEKCKYDENKLFFSKLFEIRRRIIYCHQHHKYSNSIIKEFVIANSDKQEIDKYTYRIFDNEVSDKNYELLKIEIEDTQAYEYAMLPLKIPMWIRPALMYMIKKDNQN